MNQNTDNIEDLFADGGFPHIKLCVNETVEDKTKKEFSSKNVMSIQNILDKRRNTLINRQVKPMLPSRSIVNIDIVKPNNTLDTKPLVFNLNDDDVLIDISNLDVSKSMLNEPKYLKPRRSKRSKGSKKGSKKESKKGSKKESKKESKKGSKKGSKN